MGNQSNVPQARRYQSNPIVCCGEEPHRDPLEEASPNVMNVGKHTYSRFSRANQPSQKHDQNMQFEDTGSTYYKEKDITIFRQPGNNLQASTFQNANHNDTENITKDSKQTGALRPITQQSQLRKPSSSFKKSTYGAFNSGSNTSNAFGSTFGKQRKQNLKQNQQIRIQKPLSMAKELKPKQSKFQSKQKVKVKSPFVGQGKYGGRIQEFQNNKRIISFLQENYIKEPQYKFYETLDDSSLMNNSTVKMAKKKDGNLKNKYLDQNSTQNFKTNQNLTKLQEPIELTFQIDARIILATCVLIIGIIILVLGATIFYSDVNFFICLIIAIILYVVYVLVCYIYNDLLQYFFNLRSFDQFEQDYKRLMQTEGQLAYHVHLDTPNQTIKQCYLLAKENKYTKLEYAENENRDLSIDQLKDKRVAYVLIRYKTKTAFVDPESQLNTINYFDNFLQEQKDVVQEHHGGKRQSKEATKKSGVRDQTQKSKRKGQRSMEQRQKHFKHCLTKSDFGYEINPIDGLTKKPQQVVNICYMDEADNGCILSLFVIFTLLGLCLPFLLIFESYTRRQICIQIQIPNKHFKPFQSGRRKCQMKKRAPYSILSNFVD